MEVTRNYIKNFIFYVLYLGTALGIPTFILLFNAKKAYTSAPNVVIWN